MCPRRRRLCRRCTRTLASPCTRLSRLDWKARKRWAVCYFSPFLEGLVSRRRSVPRRRRLTRLVCRVERQRGDRWRRTPCSLLFSRIVSFRWTNPRNPLWTLSRHLCCRKATLVLRRLRRSILSISTLERTSPRRRRWLDRRQRTKRFVSLKVKRFLFE